MNNFELDIHKYNNTELKEIIGLLPEPATEYNVNQKCNELCQNIKNDSQIDNSTKKAILSFVNHARKILLDETLSNASSLGIVNPFTPQSTITSAGGTDIINTMPSKYIETYPSNVVAGTLNPLNRRILRQNINIDTRFRENYAESLSSNFHLNLPLTLTNIASMQLSAIEFPTTFYPISAA